MKNFLLLCAGAAIATTAILSGCNVKTQSDGFILARNYSPAKQTMSPIGGRSTMLIHIKEKYTFDVVSYGKGAKPDFLKRIQQSILADKTDTLTGERNTVEVEKSVYEIYQVGDFYSADSINQHTQFAKLSAKSNNNP